jgi:putative ABC transport system substrate-binding protein
MNRRVFLGTLTGSVLAARLGGAQQADRTPLIGVLVVAGPGFSPVDGFWEGLRDLGHIEGRNITVEYRYAEGRAERYGDSRRRW